MTTIVTLDHLFAASHMDCGQSSCRNCPKRVKRDAAPRNGGASYTLGPPALEWWAVLGSNQWPLPCETGDWGLRINDMRGQGPSATVTWHHAVSRDITQRHDLTVPKLSQLPLCGRPARKIECLAARGPSCSGQDPTLTSSPVATPRKCHVPDARNVLAVPNVSSRNWM